MAFKPTIHIMNCKLTREGFALAKKLIHEVQCMNTDADSEMCNNAAVGEAPGGYYDLESAERQGHMEGGIVIVDGQSYTEKALKIPCIAQLLRAGLKPMQIIDAWVLSQFDLIYSSTESVSEEDIRKTTDEVTSRIGTQIRDNLSEVFAASTFDVQQLDIVVTRRQNDGVLVCNMCIEAVDES